MTGLVIVLVAAALLTGIVAWQRRSLVFAGIALLALGVAVWPWAADETPPSRAAAIERAHRAQAAEDHAARRVRGRGRRDRRVAPGQGSR